MESTPAFEMFHKEDESQDPEPYMKLRQNGIVSFPIRLAAV
jgi:hypothetical protein